MRFAPGMLVLVAGVLVLLFLVQLGAISLALDRLGLTEESALLLLVTSILGSGINLPLFRLRGDPGATPSAAIPGIEHSGGTLIAVNIGGCLVPVGLCIYLFNQVPLDLRGLLVVIAIVAAVSHRASRVVPGAGIALSPFIPPIAAAILASLIVPKEKAAAAYIGGTLGVLIGADLMKLARIRGLRTPVASIGGAGTFDGVFLTGILAVLLA